MKNGIGVPLTVYSITTAKDISQWKRYSILMTRAGWTIPCLMCLSLVPKIITHNWIVKTETLGHHYPWQGDKLDGGLVVTTKTGNETEHKQGLSHQINEASSDKRESQKWRHCKKCGRTAKTITTRMAQQLLFSTSVKEPTWWFHLDSPALTRWQLQQQMKSNNKWEQWEWHNNYSFPLQSVLHVISALTCQH